MNEANIGAESRLFALIGYPLTHSFSEKYFNEKFKKEGYSLDTTGHSLSGALATYVERRFPKRVDENLSYSRGF